MDVDGNGDVDLDPNTDWGEDYVQVAVAVKVNAASG